MPAKSVKYAFFISLSTAIILALTFVLDGYINKEGFNPSDDGVVLAQSYRIINGEIPHTDFISIRPVFSGILHTLDFLLPFPLVVSGRILTLIEYYIYSVLWVYLLMIMFLQGTRKDYFHIFLPLIIASFLLNLNTYHLYPWTTIDGILFTVLGFYIYFKTKNKKKTSLKYFLYIIALVCVSLASLAKQSFIFPAIFIYLLITMELLKEKKFSSLPLVIIPGAFPFLAYLVVLLINNNLSEFLQQMSGRTEFAETAILRYAKSFVTSKLIILYALTIYILIMDFYSRKKSNVIQKGWRFFLTFSNQSFLKIMIYIYIIATIFLSYWFILHNNYHTLPFEFFWIFLIMIFISYYKRSLTKDQTLLCASGIIIAWSASISLGANTPVYASGIMVSCIIMLNYNLLKQSGVLPLSGKYRIFLYISVLLIMHGFYFSTIYGQTKYNYRELPSKYLTRNLKDMFQAFGNIKTDPNTYDYYTDFMNIYHKLDLKNKFVLLPNNAIIYPVLGSKNPFPVDWMQGAEFVGSEQKVLRLISNVIETKDIYLLIDKYDSKEMAGGFNIKHYDEHDYPYMKMIVKKCNKVPFESKYFDIYRSIRNDQSGKDE